MDDVQTGPKDHSRKDERPRTTGYAPGTIVHSEHADKQHTRLLLGFLWTMMPWLCRATRASVHSPSTMATICLASRKWGWGFTERTSASRDVTGVRPTKASARVAGIMPPNFESRPLPEHRSAPRGRWAATAPGALARVLHQAYLLPRRPSTFSSRYWRWLVSPTKASAKCGRDLALIFNPGHY